MLRRVSADHADLLSPSSPDVERLDADRRADVDALWQRGPQTSIHADPHIGSLILDAGRIGVPDWGMLLSFPPCAKSASPGRWGWIRAIAGGTSGLGSDRTERYAERWLDTVSAP